MGYISNEGKEALKDYHYVGTDKSLLANYVMQPFWRWTVEFLPLSMAPNLVTVIGFAFVVFSYLLTAFYSGPTFDEILPWWVLVVNAACLFIYQTMDAIDGKQARRTNTSSPLGELVDHGCDALSTFLLCVTFCSATHIKGWLAVYSMIMTMAAFYAAQWQEYHTGTLELGYFGTGWWKETYTLYGYTLAHNETLVILITIPILVSFYDVLTQIRAHIKKSSLSRKTAAVRLVPFIIVAAVFLYWAFHSTINVVYTYPHLFLGAFGFAEANMISRLVLSRVTKQHFGAFQPLLAPLCFVVPLVMLTLLRPVEYYFLIFSYVYVILGYAYFSYGVVVDMTNHLNIGFLTIKDPKRMN